MNKIKFTWVILFCSLISFFGGANTITDSKSTKVTVEKSYIRATIPGTSISSSYMEIFNNSDHQVTLLAVTSNISSRIELHEHTMVDDMMRMRQIDSIEIKSKERVKLQPSGLHLMIFDVVKPLKPQQLVDLTLHFSNEKTLLIQVPVYSPIQEKALQKNMLGTHKHHH